MGFDVKFYPRSKARLVIREKITISRDEHVYCKAVKFGTVRTYFFLGKISYL